MFLSNNKVTLDSIEESFKSLQQESAQTFSSGFSISIKEHSRNTGNYDDNYDTDNRIIEYKQVIEIYVRKSELNVSY